MPVFLLARGAIQHILRQSWYFLTSKSITNGLFTIARLRGTIKSDPAPIKRSYGSRGEKMADKSIRAGRKPRKSLAAPRTKPQADPKDTAAPLVPGCAPTAKPGVIQQPIRILICDDDPADRKLVRTCLQQLTGRVITLLEATSTNEAQDALRKERIDLVFMANSACGKSGPKQLVHILKRQRVPVVILTDPKTADAAEQPLQDTASGCLPKSNLSQQVLASIIDVTLDNRSRLQQAIVRNGETQELATFDLSTGLYNRQAILIRLRESLSFANRYNEDFSMIMLDIDHFVNINNRYGRLAGDVLLERIGTVIRTNIRSADIVGRYGGDGFLIILPKTDLASSWVAADRLRSIIERTEITDFCGNVFTATVSQGLVARERTDDIDSLISRADAALRMAKEKGRNRVQILLGPALRDKV